MMTLLLVAQLLAVGFLFGVLYAHRDRWLP
jgi:hypothetical protein